MNGTTQGLTYTKVNLCFAPFLKDIVGLLKLLFFIVFTRSKKEHVYRMTKCTTSRREKMRKTLKIGDCRQWSFLVIASEVCPRLRVFRTLLSRQVDWKEQIKVYCERKSKRFVEKIIFWKQAKVIWEKSKVSLQLIGLLASARFWLQSALNQ